MNPSTEGRERGITSSNGVMGANHAEGSNPPSTGTNFSSRTEVNPSAESGRTNSAA